MSRAESPEARARRIIEELREATRDAAGALKDLQAAARQARSQVDEYLGDECQAALDKTNENLIAEMRRVQAEHEKKVIQRVIDFSALIENNFSREALITEAANRIEKLVMESVERHDRYHGKAPTEVVINLCDRPHAD